jgi:hypothetical protein
MVVAGTITRFKSDCCPETTGEIISSATDSQRIRPNDEEKRWNEWKECIVSASETHWTVLRILTRKQLNNSSSRSPRFKIWQSLMGWKANQLSLKLRSQPDEEMKQAQFHRGFWSDPSLFGRRKWKARCFVTHDWVFGIYQRERREGLLLSHGATRSRDSHENHLAICGFRRNDCQRPMVSHMDPFMDLGIFVHPQRIESPWSMTTQILRNRSMKWTESIALWRHRKSASWKNASFSEDVQIK